MQRKRERALITPKLTRFSTLPIELVEMILLLTNLDIGQLVKYRLVSKLWRASIDSIIPKILQRSIWTISLLKSDLIVLILGDTEYSINGSRIWTGEGGKVSRQIYQSLTGTRMVGRIEENKKILLKQRPEHHRYFGKWISCKSIYSSNVENIDGLIQYGIDCDSEVLLDDSSEDEVLAKLGDYDLSQYRTDLSDDEDLYF